MRGRTLPGLALALAALMGAGAAAAACGGRSPSPAPTRAATSTAPSPTSSAQHAGLRAWAVGSGGVILATADGGANWAKQASGTTSDNLTGVSFADAEHGWAVGAARDGGTMTGHVLTTSDGGAVWHIEPTPDGDVFVAVAGTGAGRVCAAGARGATAVIATTSDGGASWTTTFTATGIGYFVGLAFADADHGWAVTITGAIVGTSDGGAHWTREAAPAIQVAVGGIACADAGHCWVVGRVAMVAANPEGPFSRCWATADGGATWKAAPPPPGSYAGLRGVAMASPSRLCVVGGEGIWTTSDGGRHWRSGRPVAANASNAVSFADADHGWAVWGSIFATTDGGLTWRQQVRPAGSQFAGIASLRTGGGATK